MQSILIVDDLESIHEMLDAVIQPTGYSTVFATDGQIALEKMRRERFDIVLTDINMKPMDGIALLAKIREIDPAAIVIMMSGYANVDNATKALKLGAFDFLTKPFKVDQLMSAISRATDERRKRLEASSGIATDVASILAGDSPAVKKLKDSIERLAKTNTPVLFTGESGTQRASLAAIVHEKSAAAEGAFIALDAKQLDAEALHAELVGNEEQPAKAIVSATGGTLFVANIDHLPLTIQRSVGQQIRELKGELRFICSTSRDLERQVEKGEFEDALYFRIATNVVEPPPLRERAEDIPAIAMAFLSKKGYANAGLGDRASALLQAYRWPGNYVELKEVLEAAASAADGAVIGQDHLPEKLSDTSNWPSLADYLAAQGDRYRQQVLRACQGDRERAAGILGCDAAELA